jgi:hypothetical protein
LQQETLGILFSITKNNDPKLRYLYDHLDKDQLEIDTINFSGPRFADSNRLMSLQLVKKMTDAVMFNPDGKTSCSYFIQEKHPCF